MTNHHLGNNWHIDRWDDGDRREDLPSVEKTVHIDADTGVFSYFINGAWNTVTNNTRTDCLFLNWQIQMTLTNIGTTYRDIYPAAFDGLPLGLDTTGFTKLGVVLAWGKNGGTGRHDFRIVNNANPNQVLADTESIEGGMVTGTRRYYGIDIPSNFENFRGEVKIQAKSSVGTDGPIFYGLWGYLIRK